MSLEHVARKSSLEIIVVGTGRDGTVSLTKWFNDLFELNKIKKSDKSLFANYIEINTNDLNDPKKMNSIANHLFGKVKVPQIHKLNSHEFLDINTVYPDHQQYIQWLLGNKEWDKVAKDPSYLVLYSMDRFETWMCWCEKNYANTFI